MEDYFASLFEQYQILTVQIRQYLTNMYIRNLNLLEENITQIKNMLEENSQAMIPLMIPNYEYLNQVQFIEDSQLIETLSAVSDLEDIEPNGPSVNK